MPSPAKFWMLKGSLGAPAVLFHDINCARVRAEQIAVESGRPVYLLEVIEVFTPRPLPAPEVTREVVL